jgi:hypothetical protein
MLASQKQIETGNCAGAPMTAGVPSLPPSEGQEEIKASICEETANTCFDHFSNLSLCALVLTGSLARGEASFAQENGCWTTAGDADFLMVFKQGTRLPGGPAVELLSRRIENILRQRRIWCRVGLSAVSPEYLRSLPAHILGYELRVCGQVVRGQADILSLIPAFPAEHIPLYDAWRLLNNRMIEQLEIAEDLATSRQILPQTARYRTIKLYLDMATSLLVFLRAYKPTYRDRLEQLRSLSSKQPTGEQYPFALPEFTDRVALCTRLKIDATQLQDESLSVSLPIWREAIEYARLLWDWELTRLKATVRGFSRCLAYVGENGYESWPQWLRGWLYVLRNQGWHRSWRQWHRWGPLCLKASPRLLIYSAASPLFFRLPRLTSGPAERTSDLDWEALHQRLPLASTGTKLRKSTDWQHLAADISWNYRELLLSTRA